MPLPPLSRSALDRDHATRMRDDAIDEALQVPTTRIVLVDGDRTLVHEGAIVRIDAGRLPRSAHLVWLGRTTRDREVPVGSVVLAALVDGDEAEGADAEGVDAAGTWASLRDVGGDLDDEDAGILTQAVALGRWQRSHGFSPGDGTPLTLEQGGWAARDVAGGQHFPRTDPAVIALVQDPSRKRVLLGRNVAWADRFSLFAGFVDPGESLEAAVVREVHEEAGVVVDDVRYVASQPWPFPRSLMVGFECVATDPDVAEADGEEIAEIRWLTRDDVRAGAVGLPGGSSIASFLLQRWLDR